MSFDATRWAWQQDVKPTRKLVLLSLADRADENHVCYPSINRLHLDTGLDRKTIMTCIADLQNNGILNAKRSWGNKSEYTLIGVPCRHQTSTRNGTGTKNGTYPKNGTSTSTKNGTSQYNRSDEPISEPTNHTDQSRAQVKKLVAKYLEACPSGMLINPEICTSSILEKAKKAIEAHSLDWWADVFAKAEASDYLSGKLPASDGRFFKIKLGWIIQVHIAEKVAAGLYDNHDQKKQRVNRDPSADWNTMEVANV